MEPRTTGYSNRRFLCSKIFGTAMASDGNGGVILNIASDLSVIAPDQKLYRQENLDDSLQAVKPITYSVIKTGLVGLFVIYLHIGQTRVSGLTH